MAGWIPSPARRLPKPVLLGAAALLVTAATWWAAGAFSGDDAAARQQTATVTRGNLELTIAASGAIKPRETVDVGAQVSGQLETMHVNVGDRVEKGELLAEIDATLLEARVESARASLDGLRAQLAQQEAEAVYARQQHQRNARLYKADAISQDTVQSSEAALKVAEARIEALKAQIRQSESSLGEDEANLNYTKIYAPIDGTVISEVAVEGQTLNANQTTPTILRIADLQTMTVWAEVSEADVMRLEPGMPVYFKTLGGSEREWHATLRQVLPEPEVVNDVVLYKALIDVENHDRHLLPEMTAQVFFVEGRATDAVLVPVAALMPVRGEAGPRNGGGQRLSLATPANAAEGDTEERTRAEAPGTPARVLVVENDSQESRVIRVGLKGRSQAEVLAGLAPGDVVALPGLVRGGAAEGGERRGRGFRL